MRYRNIAKKYGNRLALTTGALVLSGSAMAGGGDNYGSILTGLDGSAAVAAFIAAATILALVGFGKWISKKVGRFFG